MSQNHFPDQSSQYWDDAAAAFDEEPDHGLRPPKVRAAWTRLLKTWLPAKKAAVLDVGCGTGSLSLVMARLGHTLTAVDFSAAMIARARAKARAARLSIDFQEMDAVALDFPPASFDVLVCRHLLWALPEPFQVLERWAAVLKPGGRMILIEGYWSTGSGLHAAQLVLSLPAATATISVEDLSDHPDLWGKQVTDERYALIADLRK